MGHALLAGHHDGSSPGRPADRPNMARIIFCDGHSRELYVDWPAKANAVVANLRAAAGRYPDDTLLASLIGDLTMRSPEFAHMWARHRVRACGLATYALRHPVAGEITVTQQTYAIAESDGKTLVINTASPGSPSAAGLALLAQALTFTGDAAELEHAPEVPRR